VQVSLYHHQLTQQFVVHACPVRPHEQSAIVLNTRSTGAEVAGKQKTSKSACKTLNAGFRLTTTHNSFDPISRFTERPSAYSTYSWTRTHCKTMVLDISHATLAYSILENFRGLELPRTRTRTRTWKLVLEDKDFPRGQQHWIKLITLSFLVHVKLQLMMIMMIRKVMFASAYS